MMEPSTDPEARLAVEGLHDSRIQEFVFLENQRFSIRLRAEDGGARWLHLEGLHLLGFQDFTSDAVLSDIYMWKLSEPTSSARRLPDVWRALLGGNYLEPDFERTVNNIRTRHQELMLVLVDTSYGGTIAAVCRGVA